MRRSNKVQVLGEKDVKKREKSALFCQKDVVF